MKKTNAEKKNPVQMFEEQNISHGLDVKEIHNVFFKKTRHNAFKLSKNMGLKLKSKVKGGLTSGSGGSL